MKHRIATLSALLLAASATVAVAQAPPSSGPPQGTPGQGGGGGAARRMQAMLEGITLTAAQQVRFDSIRAAYQAQMPAFTPGSPPDSAARAKGAEVRQHRDADLRAVLTTEQQAIWDRNLANMPQMGQRRPN